MIVNGLMVKTCSKDSILIELKMFHKKEDNKWYDVFNREATRSYLEVIYVCVYIEEDNDRIKMNNLVDKALKELNIYRGNV